MSEMISIDLPRTGWLEIASALDQVAQDNAHVADDLATREPSREQHHRDLAGRLWGLRDAIMRQAQA